MRKIFSVILLVLCAALTASAQSGKKYALYGVAFYNLENLFDTINDPDKHDEEFLPEGAKKWNSVKYQKKLSNLERVLFDIALFDKNFPAVIGVSEIENRLV
jgi:hypothetical protein